MYGFQEEVALMVYPQAGHWLTEKMLRAQGGVGFMDWFSRQTQPEYENKTPEQLLQAQRSQDVINLCTKLEQQRNNGNGQH